MRTGFGSVVMAVIIMLAFASVASAATALGPAGSGNHTVNTCPGVAVTFSVDAGTTTGPTYQWSNASGPISGATSSTYETAVAGVYTVTVKGACAGEAVSETGTLVVDVAPVILGS